MKWRWLKRLVVPRGTGRPSRFTSRTGRLCDLEGTSTIGLALSGFQQTLRRQVGIRERLVPAVGWRLVRRQRAGLLRIGSVLRENPENLF
jgi:hypothetical protein